jgi:hypothetical protein
MKQILERTFEMKKSILAATCVAIAAFATTATTASADDDAAIVTGAGGAVTGALVGGPVGAVVGGVLGVTAGAHLNPPPRKVVTYVEEQPMPDQQVVVEEKVVVGEALPETVMVEEVPDSDGYSYAFVNEQRVIVEPKTRRVVQIIQ